MCWTACFEVGAPGLEPRQAEPKSAALPLRYVPIPKQISKDAYWIASAKLLEVFVLHNFFLPFFVLIFAKAI